MYEGMAHQYVAPTFFNIPNILSTVEPIGFKKNKNPGQVFILPLIKRFEIFTYKNILSDISTNELKIISHVFVQLYTYANILKRTHTHAKLEYVRYVRLCVVGEHLFLVIVFLNTVSCFLFDMTLFSRLGHKLFLFFITKQFCLCFTQANKLPIENIKTEILLPQKIKHSIILTLISYDHGYWTG